MEPGERGREAEEGRAAAGAALAARVEVDEAEIGAAAAIGLGAVRGQLGEHDVERRVVLGPELLVRIAGRGGVGAGVEQEPPGVLGTWVDVPGAGADDAGDAGRRYARVAGNAQTGGRVLVARVLGGAQTQTLASRSRGSGRSRAR